MTLSAAASSDKTAQQEFQDASDEYFDQVYFPYQPTAGTVTGFHQYDSKLEDLAPGSVDAEVGALDSFEKRISAISAFSLDQTTRADREMLLNQIRSRRLTLHTIRPWAKSADEYSGLCANAAFTLMERKFAPADDRLRSLIAREKQMPNLLQQARTNLQNPPQIFTEIAIGQLPGIIAFFQHDVPFAFADAHDAGLRAEFAKSNAALISELNDYLVWLKSDLLPRSKGDFRIGSETFSKKLQYDEMVDIPLPKLLEIGYADLHRNQQHFAEVAKELEPDKTPREVLEELGHQHPAPDQLLGAFRATFSSLLDFIRAHHIVTIPSDVPPVLEETPPFMRATTQASMDSPGPYETRATTSYFNVTLPDPKLTPAQVESYMHSYNIGTVISTSVHEAYPGHYVQYLYSLKAPSRVRKILSANTNIEGWAHYTEQMMLDEGLRSAGNRGEERARGKVSPPGPAAGLTAAQRPLHRRHPNAHWEHDLRSGR